MAKVFISVGHGGDDPGAVAGGLKEKDINLKIALACRDELLRHKVEVRMSRTRDENDTTAEAVKECNSFNAGYAIDIHNNAGGGDGAEIYHHYCGGKGKKLAENILSEIVKTGQNSRGLKTKRNSQGRDYYAFIRGTFCPSVIVECAFLDNKKDVLAVNTEAMQEVMGKAVARGILKTLGITFIPEATKLYRVQLGAFADIKNASALVDKLKAAGFEAVIV